MTVMKQSIPLVYLRKENDGNLIKRPTPLFEFNQHHVRSLLKIFEIPFDLNQFHAQYDEMVNIRDEKEDSKLHHKDNDAVSIIQHA